jgi:hypothetical protein
MIINVKFNFCSILKLTIKYVEKVHFQVHSHIVQD